MNRQSFSKRAAAVAFGLAALAGAGAAQAAPDVHLSIGLGTPVYAQPAPVYVPQQSVYVQQQPVYVQPPPAYVQPQAVYAQPQPVYMQRYGEWGGNANGHHRYEDRQQWRHAPAPRHGGWREHD